MLPGVHNTQKGTTIDPALVSMKPNEQPKSMEDDDDDSAASIQGRDESVKTETKSPSKKRRRSIGIPFPPIPKPEPQAAAAVSPKKKETKPQQGSLVLQQKQRQTRGQSRDVVVVAGQIQAHQAGKREKIRQKGQESCEKSQKAKEGTRRCSLGIENE